MTTEISFEASSSTILDLPGNPIPPGLELSSVPTADGLVLRVAAWRPAAKPARGTILLLQGRAEFIEKYLETAGDLLERGFGVVTFDWRGQGLSGRSLADGRKGHVVRFDDFRHDLDAIAAAILPQMPGPVVGLAHSMGGCVALTAAAEGWLPVEKLVAAAPMVGLSVVKQERAVRATVRLLSLAGMASRFVPGGEARSISTLPFEGNRLCSDPRRYARNAAIATALEAGAIGAPTIGWLDAAYRAMDRLQSPGFAARITIPTLVVAAGDDPVCSTPAIELFARKLPLGSFVVIPGARHEILMESDPIRRRFWEVFDEFVAGRDRPPLPIETVQHRPVQARVAAGHDGAPFGS
jgi:lysophospholipase